MERGLKFHAIKNPARRFVVELYCAAQVGGGGGNYGIAQPAEFKVVEDSAEYRLPMIDLEEEDAVTLMDALWEAGVRPSQVGRNVDEVSAVKGHLEDMRAIAFTKLNVERP